MSTTDFDERLEVAPRPPELTEAAAQIPEVRMQEVVNPEEYAEHAIRVHAAMRKWAIAISNPRDWVQMGEEPYLTARGCDLFANRFGISTRILREPPKDPDPQSDELGKYIRYEYTVEASVIHPLTRRHVTAERIGSAETRDKFFNGSSRLPLTEVNKSNVQKKAETNARTRAIKAVLGFYPSWEELQAGFTSAGKNISKMASVQYAGKSQTEHKSTKVHDEIWQMLKEMSGGDLEIASNLLYGYTKFEGKDGKEHGCRSLKKLSEKWARSTLPKVREAYQEFLKEREGYEEEGGAA